MAALVLCGRAKFAIQADCRHVRVGAGRRSGKAQIPVVCLPPVPRCDVQHHVKAECARKCRGGFLRGYSVSAPRNSKPQCH